MIETFFGLGTLNSPQGYFTALIIGFCFGFILERAGFGSSRRLAGIFYLRDMAVLKVMFTALVTAMLGLSTSLSLGWIRPEQLYFMPTVYGAHLIGGLLFGIGFVLSGWCPGTGAVGLASGRLDALIFLLGAVAGSVFFNELFAAVKPLYNWGQAGVSFAYEVLGISRMAFGFLLTALAVGCFWGSEYVEATRNRGGTYFRSPFLKAFSLGLLIFSAGLLLLPSSQQFPAGSGLPETGRPSYPKHSDQQLLQAIEGAADHIEPIELADRILRREPQLLVVDVRTPGEFAQFHIRGSINATLTELVEVLQPYRNAGTIVLYSNGMTHPAQARDALYRMGYQNVYILTDGLKGFIETCLKPVSLRSEPVPQEFAARIAAWRDYFVTRATTAPAPERMVESVKVPGQLPGLVDTAWLQSNLGETGLKIIDVRSQPEYNTAHIPGSLFLATDSLRGVVDGIPSRILPEKMLAWHMEQMGITPSDLVVLIAGDAIRDATLAGVALERLGHSNYAVLDGGFGKWLVEKRPVDNALPINLSKSHYPPPTGQRPDSFTVTAPQVLKLMQQPGTVILDVRPKDYFTGEKSDEARAGHIPGAVNRPYTEDVLTTDGYTRLRPLTELATEYAALIPSKDTTIVVHCRTGHQASQTFFLLRHLLGYRNVSYYDAGWTEWAARLELPVSNGS